MTITRVRLEAPTDETSLAVASVYLDSVVLTGIRLYKSPTSGYFLKMPVRYSKSHDRHFETFHPLTRNFYEDMLSAVVSSYEQGLTEGTHPLTL